MYKGVKNFNHSEIGGIGVLYVNLGSPDEPTPSALRRYLRPFLADTRVIEIPKYKWWPILYGIVLVFRPKRSAKLYRSIWTDEGAPLIVTSKRQAELLEVKLRERIGEPVHVAVGMTYGNPSIQSALDSLLEKKIRKLFVLPAYAQYSATSSASVFDVTTAELRKWRWVPDFRIAMSFHDHPAYIKALANSIRDHWQKNGRAKTLFFSFHGVPTRYILAGDPYLCHCHKTARLVAEELGLNKEEYTVAFQSIFGKEEWIKPTTDKTLIALAQQGLESVEVVCPGFGADCLETLEEIEVENKHLFLEAGGKEFHYIPALNTRDDYIAALADISCENMSGWITSKAAWDQTAKQAEVDQQEKLARQTSY